MDKLKPRQMVRESVLLGSTWVLAAALSGNAAVAGVSLEQLARPAVTAEFNGFIPEELQFLPDDEGQAVKPKPQPKL
jgi:hypothetical protein